MKPDTYLQEQFIGKSFNDKLNEEMADYFGERKFSVLGFLPRPGAIAMVHTLDQGEIKQVGASEPFDIINNNFGKWLAAVFSVPTTAINSTLAQIGFGNPPHDITDSSSHTFYMYNDQRRQFNGFNLSNTFIQIGSGSTAPDTDDFNIETAFPSAPESARTLTGAGAYNPTAGRVAVGVNIGPVTDAGTINEIALFQNWYTEIPSTVTRTFLLSHDAISPALTFVGGETIFAQYFFQL